MNWKAKEYIEKAVECVKDEGVFSQDQITKLTEMIEWLRKAIEKEADSVRTHHHF